ncbi:hypothetical protein FRB94_007452 [Tulasnella sp. JGI-2019a]|nr:hypothetical protein FRB94_007452 [Tulasnella sp. JGI-2019a]KAG9002302.1 hypothetical protein FRB93_011728 [Tulasnella sp. JGI-2019a]KAG9027730.1 hypothetical protein FRB95_007427 [Tulasnella sp. JGI-2019a]
MACQNVDRARRSYSQELAKHTLQQWSQARMEAERRAAGQPPSDGREPLASATSPHEHSSGPRNGPTIKVVDFANAGRTAAVSGYVRTPVEAQ